MIAKLDGVLLDGERTAIPAELKSGSAPDPGSRFARWAAGAWDSDAIHVAIQAMALERAGYAVPRAELYYRASRTRVLVTLTPELRAEALRSIAAAREAQEATERPPPLVDSPKCRGCSLVEVCLPDESRLLREGLPPDDGLDEQLDAPPEPTAAAQRLAGGRRLVASAMETRTVTISTAGAYVRKEGEALLLVPPPDARGAPPSNAKPTRIAMDTIDALVVVGSPNVSTAAVTACLERGISVSFHQANGRLLGSVGSGLASNVSLRAVQHAWAAEPERALSLARAFVRGKIKNQRVFLRRHGVLDDPVADEWESLVRGIDKADDGDALRGVEGPGGAALLRRATPAPAPRPRGRGVRHGWPQPAAPARSGERDALLRLRDAHARVRRGAAPGRVRPDARLPARDGVGAARARPRPGGGVPRARGRLDRAPPGGREARRGGRLPARAPRRDAQSRGARRDVPSRRFLDQRREEEITHPVFGYKVSYRRAIELQARVLARVLEGEAPRYVALTTR